MKIYTKTGDKGSTSLVGGQRVKKSHQRIEAYGSVDELIAFTAHLRDNLSHELYGDKLLHIEERLMVVSSILACEDSAFLTQLPSLTEENIRFLELEIDTMESKLEPLKNFVLPGGHPNISLCHITRTVCRRVEREIIRLMDEVELDGILVKYINRLSDYLFVLSRYLHLELNVKEIPWKSQ